MYTPTIPVRRPKNVRTSEESKTDTPTTVTDTPKDTKRRSKSQDTTKKEPERKRKNIITSASVFSMGPAERSLRTAAGNKGDYVSKF